MNRTDTPISFGNKRHGRYMGDDSDDENSSPRKRRQPLREEDNHDYERHRQPLREEDNHDYERRQPLRQVDNYNYERRQPLREVDNHDYERRQPLRAGFEDTVLGFQGRLEVAERELLFAKKKIAISERKRKCTLKAYFTLVHDARAEASDLRHWIETKRKTEEEGELEDSVSEIVCSIQNRTTKIIQLGHCPISGEPIGDSTYINVCGHIFDKHALAVSKISMCPLCSHKMVHPRN